MHYSIMTRLRRLQFFALALIVMAVAMPVPAPAAAAQDFTLHNETGVEIHRLFVAPHDSDEWEEDVLGRDTLPDGESVHITFSRKEQSVKWDLRIEDGAGNFIEWENFDLLKISDITLYYKNGNPTAVYE